MFGIGGLVYCYVVGGGWMVDYGYYVLMVIDWFLDVGGYCE